MWTRGQTVWPVLRQSVHFWKHQQPLFSSKNNPTTSENVCTEMALLTATQNTSTKQKPMISKDSQENYLPASDFGNANLMLPGSTRKWNEFTPVICWHFVFALLLHVWGVVCFFFTVENVTSSPHLKVLKHVFSHLQWKAGLKVPLNVQI